MRVGNSADDGVECDWIRQRWQQRQQSISWTTRWSVVRFQLYQVAVLHHLLRRRGTRNPRQHSVGSRLATASPGKRKPVGDLPRSAGHQRPCCHDICRCNITTEQRGRFSRSLSALSDMGRCRPRISACSHLLCCTPDRHSSTAAGMLHHVSLLCPVAIWLSKVKCLNYLLTKCLLRRNPFHSIFVLYYSPMPEHISGTARPIFSDGH